MFAGTGLMYAGAHDPDHPDVVAAHAALHGKDGDDPQSHAMHLLVRAASKWGHERISRSFNSWLAVANKVSKRATSASVAHVLSVEPKHRTKDELDLVKAFLVGHHPTYFGTLPREGMDIVARAISMQQVERNEVLCMQGEVGAHFYVVMAGQIAVCAHPDRRTAAGHLVDYQAMRMSDGRPLKREYLGGYCGSTLRTVHPGESVGEMALFTSGCVRSASLVGKAAGTTEVLVLDKWVYRQCLAPNHGPFLVMKEKLTLLRSLPAFVKFDNTRLVHFAYAFEVRLGAVE